MTNELTAAEICELLKLEPHATCGFVRVTFLSKQRIAPGGLPAPFLDDRPEIPGAMPQADVRQRLWRQTDVIDRNRPRANVHRRGKTKARS